LHFVKLAPNGGGGFVVQQVDPESVYQQLGVQAGDVIYSIDPPPDSSLDVSFLRAEVKLEVFRDGQSVWLSYKPEQEPVPPPRSSSPQT
jgi:S1-C subfamily serine protease